MTMHLVPPVGIEPTSPGLHAGAITISAKAAFYNKKFEGNIGVEPIIFNLLCAFLKQNTYPPWMIFPVIRFGDTTSFSVNARATTP